MPSQSGVAGNKDVAPEMEWGGWAQAAFEGVTEALQDPGSVLSETARMGCLRIAGILRPPEFSDTVSFKSTSLAKEDLLRTFIVWDLGIDHAIIARTVLTRVVDAIHALATDQTERPPQNDLYDSRFVLASAIKNIPQTVALAA